jgi:CheY-like chemotaxis protein
MTQKQTTAPSPTVPERTVFPAHRILMVDDNRDAAESQAWLLRLCGQTVQTAYDGPTALRIAAAFAPEIVFLDLIMPRTDGLALAHQLRDLPNMRSARIVALTGYRNAVLRQATDLAGFDGHILKPASTIDFTEFLTG